MCCIITMTMTITIATTITITMHAQGAAKKEEARMAAAREAAQAEGTKNGVTQIFTDEQIKARADGQARAKSMRLDYKKRCATCRLGFCDSPVYNVGTVLPLFEN
jgi:hypothetical protein